MAATVQKITLSSSRDIPFNKLVLSQANVRRIKAGVSIEELATSIARRGLIQSLSVQAVTDAEGVETGMFEVPAGGRRFRALELLVKGKRLAKTAPVPCVVRERDSGILAEEVSLAENIERAPLHPLDQYRAFQDMLDKGMTEEAIAAAFFVPVSVVKQRLRLASVSPALLEVYADDGMTLEQLMAFTVSAEHDRQLQVWEAIKDAWSKEPYQIRRMLTENPHVAMTALLHKLVMDTFQHRSAPGCLEASVRHVFFPVQAEELKDSPSAKAVTERHEAWKADLPADDDALWDWLAALDDASRMALLAHCVSYGVNALYEKADRYGGAVTAHGVQQRIAQADRLARALGLDMVEAGWTPTVGNYLGRVTKPRIIEAVREARGEQASQLIDHLKKGDMAKEAERLLADSGWLPEPLRLSDIDGAAGEGNGEADGEASTLPEFLASEEDGSTADGAPAHLIAAE